MARKKVMVVDDEKGLIDLVEGLLKDKNYDVIVATNGNDCLEKLETSKPDLILMDMMMPGMSGIEVCEHIRANPKTKNLKIAFLTVAKYSVVGKENIERLKIINFITKPFDNEDLLKRIKKIVG